MRRLTQTLATTIAAVVGAAALTLVAACSSGNPERGSITTTINLHNGGCLVELRDGDDRSHMVTTTNHSFCSTVQAYDGVYQLFGDQITVSYDIRSTVITKTTQTSGGCTMRLAPIHGETPYTASFPAAICATSPVGSILTDTGKDGTVSATVASPAS